MLLTMKLTWQCLSGPRLYKIYRDGPIDAMYKPQGLEKWGDKIITTLYGGHALLWLYCTVHTANDDPRKMEEANTLMNIGIYTSPFICMYIYRRGFFTIDESKSILRFFGGISCLLFISYVMRGYGRASNSKYVQFLEALMQPINDKAAYFQGIRKYDFDFSAWPVSYNVASKLSSSWLDKNPLNTCANSDLPLYQRGPIQLLAFIATHTFALRLIYPGSLSLIHNLLWAPLLQGRAHLVENYNGQRSKLRTADNNDIDTMFVDNRDSSVKGRTLVVCCEGNSGFYEVGIMTTPIKAGYSALGWNHPGFASSTGLPYPSQEHNAIDAVMQYAINELKFEPENIVMFGWSIGGYSATWAAVNYPVKALVLDATFDDLLPLAQNQMPSSWSLLVKEVVRSYVDLNIAEIIKKYDGPVHLVRRTEDEIICLRQGQLSTNRGNYLALSLISHRHPDTKEALEALTKFVAMQDSHRATSKLEEEKKIVSLISKYMRDYKSTHCTPLPDDRFQSIMDDIVHSKRD